MSRRFSFIVTLFFFLSIFGTACEVIEPCEVDAEFREFHYYHGGVDILGCPISPKFSSNGKFYQYTPDVLMVYNPSAPPSSQYYFSDLGLQLGLARQPLNPDSPTGHDVYFTFRNTYQELGGARVVGRPITGVETDRDRQRIYQCFENLCLYQQDYDPEGKVGLLDLGAVMCGEACGYLVPEIETAPQLPSTGPFDEVIKRLGYQLAGNSLGDGFYSADGGALEQIYENIALYSDSSQPAGVGLRPLPLILGLARDPLEMVSADANFNFYAVEGDLGYNVPNSFWDYINMHSGFEFLGAPITSYQQIGDNLYRQCFENICLHYLPDAMPGYQVEPMPLGYNYQKMLRQEGVLEGGMNSYDGLHITVWEAQPVMPSGSNQVISALVIDGQTPLRNIELGLTVTFLEGEHQVFYLTPTDGQGRTSIQLPPFQSRNGTYIEYELCVLNLDGADKCVTDDFLIWETP